MRHLHKTKRRGALLLLAESCDILQFKNKTRGRHRRRIKGAKPDFAIRQKRLGAHAQKRRSRPLGTRPPGYNAPMALMGIRDLSCSLCVKSVEVPSREREQNSHCESHRKTCLQGLFMTEHQEFLQNSPSALIQLGPTKKGARPNAFIS
ncbi:hypothetical protein MMG03_002349 [Fibrobacter succinogenes]|nr:hypothetical protein [Fibrobacter succinogenes]